MTQEELLAGIDKIYLDGFDGALIDALRAVVKFHKPWGMETGPEDDPETETLMGCECIPQLPAFLNPWPCPTIQIIMEELTLGEHRDSVSKE
jgi:hypothetical protein